MVSFWEQDARPKLPTLSEFTPELRQGLVDVLFFQTPNSVSQQVDLKQAIVTADVIDTLSENTHQMAQEQQQRLQHMREQIEQQFTTLGESLSHEIEQLKAAALINQIQGRVVEDIAPAELQAIEDELAEFRATADFETLSPFVEAQSLLLSSEIEEIQDDAAEQAFEDRFTELRSEEQHPQRFEQALAIAVDILNESETDEVQVGSQLLSFIEADNHLMIRDENGRLWMSAKLRSGTWWDEGSTLLSETWMTEFMKEVQQLKQQDLRAKKDLAIE
jgi:hypothetical protein